MEGELYLALVYSSKAHARIISINESKALLVKGVHAFFSAKDLPSNHNMWGPVIHDEEIFASEKVRKIYCLVICFNQSSHNSQADVKIIK